VLIPYRSFEKTYRSPLQVSRYPTRTDELDQTSGTKSGVLINAIYFTSVSFQKFILHISNFLSTYDSPTETGVLTTQASTLIRIVRTFLNALREAEILCR
jgi:hypothetical protein